ncbi:MAG: hypothetical protein K2X09_00790 [Rickettsiales bacterium]|nr:hypothetical protein [Rickettsiales bacterium]
MTDTTSDPNGVVARILEQHDPHHAGAGTWTDTVPAPRCHAVQAGMAGVPSQHVENTLRRIIGNGNIGTAADSLAAQAWLDRARQGVADPDVAPSNPMGW